MPKLSDMPGTPPFGVLVNKHVAFTAFLKANPVAGKRSEMIRSLDRQSALIETQIEDICGTEAQFDYSKPIAYTVGFGKYPPRFTVNGFACVRTTFFDRPISETVLDFDNAGATGPDDANWALGTPSDDVEDIALEVKSQLESATGLICIHLKIAGFIYGTGGVGFPVS